MAKLADVTESISFLEEQLKSIKERILEVEEDMEQMCIRDSLYTECNHKNRAKQLQMYPIFGHVDARGIKTKEICSLPATGIYSQQPCDDFRLFRSFAHDQQLDGQLHFCLLYTSRCV